MHVFQFESLGIDPFHHLHQRARWFSRTDFDLPPIIADDACEWPRPLRAIAAGNECAIQRDFDSRLFRALLLQLPRRTERNDLTPSSMIATRSHNRSASSM